MVLDHASEHPSLWAAVMLISAKIGCTPQALHDWVKKAEVDSGQRAGVPTDTAERLKALERENRELSRWKRSSVVLCSWLPRLSSSQSEYAYDEDRLVLRGGLSTHKHVFNSELKSG
jgi:transposase-like protein